MVAGSQVAGDEGVAYSVAVAASQPAGPDEPCRMAVFFSLHTRRLATEQASVLSRWIIWTAYIPGEYCYAIVEYARLWA